MCKRTILREQDLQWQERGGILGETGCPSSLTSSERHTSIQNIHDSALAALTTRDNGAAARMLPVRGKRYHGATRRAYGVLMPLYH